MKLSVVRVLSSSCRWAVKAESDSGEIRYRGFYYNKDAHYDLGEWKVSGVDQRNFKHNFFTAETLRVVEGRKNK